MARHEKKAKEKAVDAVKVRADVEIGGAIRIDARNYPGVVQTCFE